MSLLSLSRVSREFRRELVAIGLYSGLINLLLITPTLYMLQVFDRVMASRNELTLIIISAITLFFLILLAIAEWARARLMLGVANSLEEKNKRMLFGSIFWRAEKNIADAPTQVFIDVATVKQWLTSNSAYAFFDLPFSLIYIVVMFALHPMLGLFTIASILILAIFAFQAARDTSEISQAADKHERDMESFVYQKIRNSVIISTLGMIGNIKLTWLSKESEATRIRLKNQKVESKHSVGAKEVRTLLQCLAIAVAAMLVIIDQISFGAMVAAGLLINRATSPVDQIVTGWKGLSGARDALERLRLSFSYTNDSTKSESPNEQPIAVKFEAVSYSLNRGGYVVLDNICVSYVPSAVHLIVGESGAGKSTLGKLMLGIIPPDTGTVGVNEVPLPVLSQEWRRNNFAYVPQEPSLFDGTVADNIARMATPDPERVIRASKMVGIHEDVLKLPKGYNTTLDSSGSPLSGGQKQLLSLARAIYTDPRLIFLDEPNSNLDMSGQEAILSVVKYLREIGSTVFIVTHRSQILSVADSITVLREGRLVYHGPPNKEVLDAHVRLSK